MTTPAEMAFMGWELEEDPDRFVGLTVTMAGKDPVRWEYTTITAVVDGVLVLSGGDHVTRIFSDTPRRTPLTEQSPASRVPRWEVARGIIHHTAEPDRQPKS